MKIAIIGTRGIPNNYGGFEQFAEYLSLGLQKRNYDITVYNSHTHPYKLAEWNGVKIVHCYDPEYKWGTVGQFVYDYNCIKHARKQHYDIILQLGYGSNSVWGWLLPKQAIITTNMDGLEWKRTKFSKPVRCFLKYAERLGVKYSNYLIADSLGIQTYLKEKYGKPSVYIPYGATVFNHPNQSPLAAYNVKPYEYNMLIARLEPENSIDIILQGVSQAASNKPFLVVGKHHTKYGTYLKNKYQAFPQIHFVGGIYDMQVLNNLRYYSNVYFHGHTVGGTNPSLLEAMASQALVCAHNNAFNAAILENDALYFETAADVKKVIEEIQKKDYCNSLQANIKKIETIYNWEKIIEQYEAHFRNIASSKKQSYE